MSAGQNKEVGRTQWDLLLELVRSRKAIQWAAIITWLAIACVAVAIRVGFVTIQLTGDSSHSGAKTQKRDSHNIRIISPGPGESVTPPFTVSGHSDPLPAGFELWLFTTLPPGSREEYWPLAPSDIEKDGTWRVTVSPGNWKSGETKHYTVFLVGENGQALIRYYKLVMKEMSAPDAPWKPLTVTTPDMVKCVAPYAVKLK